MQESAKPGAKTSSTNSANGVTAPSRRKKRGRKPEKDRTKVREVRVEFMVTEAERDLLDEWAREDGAENRSIWIREQLRLPGIREE